MFTPLRPVRSIGIVAVLLSFFACNVARHSRFVTDSSLLGMDTATVAQKFGKPYKVGVVPEHEDWYYKENLYADKWYEVTTILHFTNGKLTSVEPGRERPLYQDRADVKVVSKD